jgi:hypothetical protein
MMPITWFGLQGNVAICLFWRGWGVVGFELRALHLLGRRSTTWAWALPPPQLFAFYGWGKWSWAMGRSAEWAEMSLTITSLFLTNIAPPGAEKNATKIPSLWPSMTKGLPEASSGGRWGLNSPGWAPPASPPAWRSGSSWRCAPGWSARPPCSQWRRWTEQIQE